MIDDSFRIELANWDRDQADLRLVRQRVFIEEQSIPEDEEWDAMDAPSHHVLARDAQGNPIGTGRLTTDRKIGRVAVIKEWRRRGVAEAMMRTLLEQARALAYPEIMLHSQVYAIPFYERLGFAVEGQDYLECGIPHRNMRLNLTPVTSHPPDIERLLVPNPTARAVEIDTRDDAIAFADELVLAARHKLWLYSRDLDSLLFDREPFLDALKRVALSGRAAEIRILLVSPGDAVRGGHRLLRLAERLTSLIHIRTPVIDEDRQYPSAYLLNDVGGYLLRPLGNRYEGEGNTHAPGRHGQLLFHFQAMWERSEAPPELRRLGI